MLDRKPHQMTQTVSHLFKNETNHIDDSELLFEFNSPLDKHPIQHPGSIPRFTNYCFRSSADSSLDPLSLAPSLDPASSSSNTTNDDETLYSGSCTSTLAEDKLCLLNEENTASTSKQAHDCDEQHVLPSSSSSQKSRRFSFSKRNDFLASCRRLNPIRHHSKISVRHHSLDQNIVFSQYNNYLNERIFHPQRNEQQDPDAKDQFDLERKQKMEELVDKFWLRDGGIDEEMFEDSSDEEPLY